MILENHFRTARKFLTYSIPKSKKRMR